MKPRPSLNDVAKTLGVSAATVSNAVSSKGRISADLKKTIRERAAEMGYVPSSAGRALRTGRSGFLGLVLADIAHPLFPQIAQAIENAATDFGYGILIGDSRGDVSIQKKAIDRLIERGADGVIIVPRHGSQVGDIGRPMAVIDSEMTPGNTVSADHRDGGKQVGKHLIELGHRNVAIIGGFKDSNVQHDRINGVKSAFPSDAEIQTLWIEDIELEGGTGCELGLARMVSEGVTAFVAVSDLHALRALTELQRAGFDVPGQVSVTGFDDLIWSNVISPTMTTVRMDMPKIAEIAVSNVIRQINDEMTDEDRQNLSVPMTLIARQSTGPAPTTLKN
ncbi:MAG: LacI family DNA-binding transcriptional regulator [Rhizobiaceae bacterium]|nr:LacI family DNA-binding transcriptional regulator [Rhizobiaceae bacterium]